MLDKIHCFFFSSILHRLFVTASAVLQGNVYPYNTVTRFNVQGWPKLPRGKSHGQLHTDGSRIFNAFEVSSTVSLFGPQITILEDRDLK